MINCIRNFNIVVDRVVILKKKIFTTKTIFEFHDINFMR